MLPTQSQSSRFETPFRLANSGHAFPGAPGRDIERPTSSIVLGQKCIGYCKSYLLGSAFDSSVFDSLADSLVNQEFAQGGESIPLEKSNG